MGKVFSPEFIKQAHKATIYNEEQIRDSKVCTYFYCGYQFDPQIEEELDWIEERSPKNNTLRCPKCYIDCIIGDASGFPITDKDFIMACTEAWFGGNSRISYGKPIEKVNLISIEVN